VIHLRLSTRDRRAKLGRPVALVDADHNRVVDGMRARVLLEQVSAFARNLDAATLHGIASETCLRLHNTTEYDRLSLGKFSELINQIRSELRPR
jgi:hypothetical protein